MFSWVFSGAPYNRGRMGKALDQVVRTVNYEMSVLVPYVDNDHLDELLLALDRRGAALGYPIKLRIVISGDPMPYVTNLGQLDTLEALLTDPTQYLSLYVEAKIGGTLHAKVYLADSTGALITSGNLTGGGMSHNIEAGFLIDDSKQAQNIRADFDRYWTGKAVEDFDLDKLKIAKHNLDQ